MLKSRRSKINVSEFKINDKDIDAENFLIITNDTEMDKKPTVISDGEINEEESDEEGNDYEFKFIINNETSKYHTYTELINNKNLITKIDASNHKISKLSERFYDALIKLDKLTELKLNNNFLNVLSSKLFECVSIKKLDLSQNILCKDSTINIHKLINLEELNLSSCGDYSENIYLLSNLLVLDLSYNCKSSYIKRIDNFLATSATISVRGYKDIAKKFFCLKSVRGYKDIAKKFFCLEPDKNFSIPKDIIRLKNLKTLNMSYCGLRSIPLHVYYLTTLTHLDVSNNNIRSLSKKITNLNNLKKLKLFNFTSSNLQTCTPEIWEIKCITELDLSNVVHIPQKNNDSDIKLTMKIDGVIPNNIKRLVLNSVSSKGKDMNNFPLDIEDLTIISNSGVKLDNLPINLKKLTVKYGEFDYYNKTKWIDEYINNGYIKVPFGCELVHD